MSKFIVLKGLIKIDKKELKKAINQLGRIKKSRALDPLDKKTIERIRKKLYTKINNNKGVKKMFLVDIIELSRKGVPINVDYDIFIGSYETLEQAKQAIQEDFNYFTPTKITAYVDYIIYNESNDKTDRYKNELETITFNI